MQLKESSQNSVSNGDTATWAKERFNRKFLKPGITDFWIPNPMVPARKLYFLNPGLVTHDSLPIHCRGGKGSRESSASRILMSPDGANATTTIDVDLVKKVQLIRRLFLSYPVCKMFSQKLIFVYQSNKQTKKPCKKSLKINPRVKIFDVRTCG